MRAKDMMAALLRWTPFVVVFPRLFVGRGREWASFDFDDWSARYRWTEDRWNGWFDVARRPRETISEKRGDCEDYALVAASWALARGRTPVGLGFCFVSVVPRHAVAYDRDRVYSSGEVTDETLDEYLARSEYRWVLRRRLA